MNKSILWLIGLLFVTSFTIVSCSETDGVEDPYANWAERNQKYIDSIATVAKANPSEWKKIHTYKFNPPSLGMEGDVNDYVYCKIIESGDGASPLFTDTVAINYRGKLINGTVFDQSYQGALNTEVAVPYKGVTGSFVVGFTTALMEMKVGDRWEVYIPYDLGYGTGDYNSIPGFSTMIFDLDLAAVYPLKGNLKAVAEE
ncbi:FKBP-type peptidyl-prolyl cis-trans isomerase [Phocaeicola sp.]